MCGLLASPPPVLFWTLARDVVLGFVRQQHSLSKLWKLAYSTCKHTAWHLGSQIPYPLQYLVRLKVTGVGCVSYMVIGYPDYDNQLHNCRLNPFFALLHVVLGVLYGLFRN